MQDMQFYREEEEEYDFYNTDLGKECNNVPPMLYNMNNQDFNQRSDNRKHDEYSEVSNNQNQENSLMADLKGSFTEELNLSNLPNQQNDQLMNCALSQAPSMQSVAFSSECTMSIKSQNSDNSQNGQDLQYQLRQQQQQLFNKEIYQQNWEETSEQNMSSTNSSFLAEGGEVNTLPPVQEEQENKQEPKERVYYADWVRAAAIILVIFVHCLVNSFDASGLEPDDVPEIQQKKDGIIKCLVQIGIPMFFYISGIGSTFFNTEKKHYGIFVGGKILRLIVPFVVAIFVFLIPRLYFGQQYEDFTRPNDEIVTNYWEYMKLILPNIHQKLSWLWYLPALFIDVMLTYPLLRWSIRRSKQIPFDPLTDIGIVCHQIVLLAIWAVINVTLVTYEDYGQDLLMPSICVLGGVMFCFYTFQLLINRPNGYHYAIWIKLIGPIGSILLCLFKVQTKNQNLYHIFLMVNFDAIFFSQGVVDMCYWKQMVKKRGELANTSLAPLSIVGFLFIYAMTCPTNYSEMGHLFFYPLYTDHTLQMFYVVGTWAWLTIIIWTMAHVANDKYNDTFYKYFTGSAMYAYVSHYFFILVIGVFIVRPYKISFIGAFFLMFFGTFLCIYATYIPLNMLWELCFPEKETVKKEMNTGEVQTEEQKQEKAAAAKAEAIEKANGGEAVDLEAENQDHASQASNQKPNEVPE